MTTAYARARVPGCTVVLVLEVVRHLAQERLPVLAALMGFRPFSAKNRA